RAGRGDGAHDLVGDAHPGGGALDVAVAALIELRGARGGARRDERALGEPVDGTGGDGIECYLGVQELHGGARAAPRRREADDDVALVALAQVAEVDDRRRALPGRG